MEYFIFIFHAVLYSEIKNNDQLLERCRQDIKQNNFDQYATLRHVTKEKVKSSFLYSDNISTEERNYIQSFFKKDLSNLKKTTNINFLYENRQKITK